MRNIFHEILARYLDSEQHAFDASPRELWPSVNEFWNPQLTVIPASRSPERYRHQLVNCELEPQR
jgi:hypothetical protein